MEHPVQILIDSYCISHEHIHMKDHSLLGLIYPLVVLLEGNSINLRLSLISKAD